MSVGSWRWRGGIYTWMINYIYIRQKEQVLKYFTEAGGILRLVIATTAFVMGIDCPDVQRVLHIQASGWARGDGELSVAVLYDGKGGRHVNFNVMNFFFLNLKYVDVDDLLKGFWCINVWLVMLWCMWSFLF